MKGWRYRLLNYLTTQQNIRGFLGYLVSFRFLYSFGTNQITYIKINAADRK